MRVARLHDWGDVRVEEMPMPTLAPNEALLRIEACGVCGSDALDWYVASKAPVVLGHEPAGVIAAVGSAVHHVRPGDRVFVHHHAPCGECAECRRALWSNCRVWRQTRLDPGGFAEYARVMQPNLTADTLRLPDSMDFETATFIEPLACCLRAVQRQGAMCAGDAVLVIGLGAMGLLMVQLARVFDASAVLGSDFLENRREAAMALGAGAAFDPAADNVADRVRDATDGRGADVVLVCPGSSAAVQAGLEAAAPGARVVCFTPLAPAQALALEPSKLYFREVTLTQSYSCGPDETRAALRLLDHGDVRVRELITHRGGLPDVARALERAAGKGAGLKTIIHPAL
jgi:L-iditol 2-dehydrogenase